MKKILIDAVFLLVAPFLFAGLVNRVKSFWAGRQGPPLLQPFRDTLRLLRKGAVISTVSTWILTVSQPSVLASVLAAAAVTPLLSGRAMISFPGDFAFFACALGFGRFMMISGAMDAGSSFQGMGASREANFAVVAETSFIFLAASLACLGRGETSMGALAASTAPSNAGPAALVLALLSSAALFIMLTLEGSRVPADDPNTHLELTMIHEVMVLDLTSFDLAATNFAAWLRMVLCSSFAANILSSAILPPSAGIGAGAATVVAIVVAFAILLGFVESLMARLRMTHVPQYLLFMLPLGTMVLAGVFLTRGGVFK